MAENKRLLILGKSGSGGGGTQVQSDWAETDDQSMSYIKNKPELSSVATSGNYDDLLNKPTIPNAQVNSDWNAETGISQILNKPTLSIVATSGSYNDLLNKPTIPAAQVNSDWNAETGVSQILNKPQMTTQTLTFVDENNVETNVVVYIQPTV